MKKLLLAVFFLVLLVLPAAAQAVCTEELQVVKVVMNNYFAASVWPGQVTALGPRPFVKNNLPAYFTSFDGYKVQIDNGFLSQWTLYQQRLTNGCYQATWKNTQIIDDPYRPSWCVAAPAWAQYCSSKGRGNEKLKVVVWDETGAADEGSVSNVPCVPTTRGSLCKF